MMAMQAYSDDINNWANIPTRHFVSSQCQIAMGCKKNMIELPYHFFCRYHFGIVSLGCKMDYLMLKIGHIHSASLYSKGFESGALNFYRFLLELV